MEQQFAPKLKENIFIGVHWPQRCWLAITAMSDMGANHCGACWSSWSDKASKNPSEGHDHKPSPSSKSMSKFYSQTPMTPSASLQEYKVGLLSYYQDVWCNAAPDSEGTQLKSPIMYPGIGLLKEAEQCDCPLIRAQLIIPLPCMAPACPSGATWASSVLLKGTLTCGQKNIQHFFRKTCRGSCSHVSALSILWRFSLQVAYGPNNFPRAKGLEGIQKPFWQLDSNCDSKQWF